MTQKKKLMRNIIFHQICAWFMPAYYSLKYFHYILHRMELYLSKRSYWGFMNATLTQIYCIQKKKMQLNVHILVKINNRYR
jgi:hypothetical protein